MNRDGAPHSESLLPGPQNRPPVPAKPRSAKNPGSKPPPAGTTASAIPPAALDIAGESSSILPQREGNLPPPIEAPDHIGTPPGFPRFAPGRWYKRSKADAASPEIVRRHSAPPKIRPVARTPGIPLLLRSRTAGWAA